MSQNQALNRFLPARKHIHLVCPRGAGSGGAQALESRAWFGRSTKSSSTPRWKWCGTGARPSPMRFAEERLCGRIAIGKLRAQCEFVREQVRLARDTRSSLPEGLWHPASSPYVSGTWARWAYIWERGSAPINGRPGRDGTRHRACPSADPRRGRRAGARFPTPMQQRRPGSPTRTKYAGLNRWPRAIATLADPGRTLRPDDPFGHRARRLTERSSHVAHRLEARPS